MMMNDMWSDEAIWNSLELDAEFTIAIGNACATMQQMRDDYDAKIATLQQELNGKRPFIEELSDQVVNVTLINMQIRAERNELQKRLAEKSSWQPVEDGSTVEPAVVMTKAEYDAAIAEAYASGVNRGYRGYGL